VVEAVAIPPPHVFPLEAVVLLPLITLKIKEGGSPTIVKSTFSPKYIDPPYNDAEHVVNDELII
jgi:hypothetical protein